MLVTNFSSMILSAIEIFISGIKFWWGHVNTFIRWQCSRQPWRKFLILIFLYHLFVSLHWEDRSFSENKGFIYLKSKVSLKTLFSCGPAPWIIFTMERMWEVVVLCRMKSRVWGGEWGGECRNAADDKRPICRVLARFELLPPHISLHKLWPSVNQRRKHKAACK